MKIEVDIDDITWQCGDCGNTYDLAVQYCPNNILDRALLNMAHSESKKVRRKERRNV